jgi:hypothetical protein
VTSSLRGNFWEQDPSDSKSTYLVGLIDGESYTARKEACCHPEDCLEERLGLENERVFEELEAWGIGSGTTGAGEAGKRGQTSTAKNHEAARSCP